VEQLRNGKALKVYMLNSRNSTLAILFFIEKRLKNIREAFLCYIEAPI